MCESYFAIGILIGVVISVFFFNNDEDNHKTT